MGPRCGPRSTRPPGACSKAGLRLNRNVMAPVGCFVTDRLISNPAAGCTLPENPQRPSTEPSMKRSPGVLAALVLGAAAFLPLAATAQPLPTNPKLTTGTLDNGLKYIILPHTVPPGRVEMYVHMDTGSLNETARQRGIAHYLEHMAFNGSQNLPPASVVPFFQSIGLQFGRDQNAFTNMQETSFQLSLPANDKETIGKGFSFFSDVVGRLSLLPKEIDAERQIIQEERRRGLSGQQRTGFYVTEHIAPGSTYGPRITIGTEQTINGVNEQDFKDYYGTWYAASNATLIVVADADPATVVPVIKEQFGAAPKRPRPTPQDLH